MSPVENLLNIFKINLLKHPLERTPIDTSQLSDDEFMEFIKKRHEIFMLFGVIGGLWEGFDVRGPIPFPKIFKKSDFSDKETLAHIFAKAGIFDSITEAKKNGWNKPITTGEWKLTKRKIRVIIE